MKAGEELAQQSHWGGALETLQSWELQNTEGEKPGMLLLGGMVGGAPGAGVGGGGPPPPS